MTPPARPASAHASSSRLATLKESLVRYDKRSSHLNGLAGGED
jgi:hypothetical protein